MAHMLIHGDSDVVSSDEDFPNIKRNKIAREHVILLS